MEDVWYCYLWVSLSSQTFSLLGRYNSILHPLVSGSNSSQTAIYQISFMYSSCFLLESGLSHIRRQCSAGLSTSLLEVVDLNKGDLFVYISVNLVCRSVNRHTECRSSLYLKCSNCRNSLQGVQPNMVLLSLPAEQHGCKDWTLSLRGFHCWSC